jgi:hypothetical protein
VRSPKALNVPLALISLCNARNCGLQVDHRQESRMADAELSYVALVLDEAYERLRDAYLRTSVLVLRRS